MESQRENMDHVSVADASATGCPNPCSRESDAAAALRHPGLSSFSAGGQVGLCPAVPWPVLDPGSPVTLACGARWP